MHQTACSLRLGRLPTESESLWCSTLEATNISSLSQSTSIAARSAFARSSRAKNMIKEDGNHECHYATDQAILDQNRPLLNIQREQQYDEAVGRLSSLIDDVGTDEPHPL